MFSKLVYRDIIDAKTDVVEPADMSLTGETCPKEKKQKTGMHVVKDATNSSLYPHLSTAPGSLHILKQALTDSMSWTPIFQNQLLLTAYIPVTFTH